MTKREAAIVEAYTGYAILIGSNRRHLYEYINDELGIPCVDNSSFSDKDFCEKVKIASRSDFYKLGKQIQKDGLVYSTIFKGAYFDPDEIIEIKDE